MKTFARLLLLAVSLAPLGCPLLRDDDFVLVDGDALGEAGTDGGGNAGAPSPPACPAACSACVAGVCQLECQGEGACKDRALKCPSSMECHVVCAGKEACSKVRVTCPASLTCTIECADHQDACKDMTVTCGTGRCEAQCHGEAKGPPLTCGNSAECMACK